MVYDVDVIMQPLEDGDWKLLEEGWKWRGDVSMVVDDPQFTPMGVDLWDMMEKIKLDDPETSVVTEKQKLGLPNPLSSLSTSLPPTTNPPPLLLVFTLRPSATNHDASTSHQPRRQQNPSNGLHPPAATLPQSRPPPKPISTEPETPIVTSTHQRRPYRHQQPTANSPPQAATRELTAPSSHSRLPPATTEYQLRASVCRCHLLPFMSLWRCGDVVVQPNRFG
ncbi:hypothetical protein RIF29_24734 [Crotalaria pallida]|uniref:Uncharacterized protein n=1 Tax=Crotalaria pallida TaxID=3830 RepID=A0AAN9I0G1_CROPI